MTQTTEADAPPGSATFAANRAIGSIALSVAAARGGSARARVHEAGSLRVRFPNGDNATALDAIMLNTAGGMTGGDRFTVDIKIGGGARMTVTTAAAEKVYRSPGPDTDIAVTLAVGPGGALTWLPQETILFDRARLHRTIDIELAGSASLLVAEAIVFGRSAMGEVVRDGYLFDRWRVRVDGVLMLAETMRLDGAIARRLANSAVAAEARRSQPCSSFPATTKPPRRCAPCSRVLPGKSAYRPGTDWRWRGWSRPTARRSAAI